MKVLITGGAGFIGSHLTDLLLGAGQEVTIVDDLSTGSVSNLRHNLSDGRLKLIVGSAADETLIEPVIKEVDVIYHLASSVGVELIMSQPMKTIHNIFDTTAVVMKLASRYRKKVLVTSTSEVYGKSSDVPFREDGDRLEGATTTHRWAYASAKALDEFLALAYFKMEELPVSIVRLFNTVGPRQSANYGMVIPKMVRAALSDTDIIVHGDGNQSRCFCHVSEAVEALRKIMESSKCDGEVINVGSNQETTINDLAKLVIETTASKSDIYHIDYSVAFPDGGFEDMKRRVPSIEKAKTLVGWEPKIMLRHIIEDVRDQQNANSQ